MAVVEHIDGTRARWNRSEEEFGVAVARKIATCRREGKPLPKKIEKALAGEVDTDQDEEKKE